MATGSFYAKIDGNLRETLLHRADEIGNAARQAVESAANKLKDELRAQTAGAGLGSGLANAWQVLPPRGRFAFSALVYSKAPLLHRAFDMGGTITAQNGIYLVIPLDAAVKLGLATSKAHNKGGANRALNRKWSDVDAAIDMFGNLRFVPLKGGNQAILFGDQNNIGKPRGAKISRTGQRQDIALFLLVKQTRLPKKLDVEGAASRALAQLKTNLGNILGKQ